jgi:hypothetical protein
LTLDVVVALAGRTIRSQLFGSSFTAVSSVSVAGTGILQYGLLGMNDVAAMVSFHGGLDGLPEPNVTFEPKVLILSGGEDDTSSQIMDMEIALDTAAAPWEITRYSGIEHAFTVWTDGK